MGRPTKAIISKEALTFNWNLLKKNNPDQALFIPVLKANAYGHGACSVAMHLQSLGATSAAIALIEEAEELRAAGFTQTIYLLGPFESSQVADIQRLKVTPIVSDLECLKILSNQIKTQFHIHLKWDTNMNRLGLREEQFDSVISILSQYPQLCIDGLCTHFLKGDDLINPDGYSQKQVQVFQKILLKFKENPLKNIKMDQLKIHIFNTDAFLNHIQHPFLPTYFGARLGLSLYGYASVETEISKQLKPIMKLCSKIVHIKSIKQNEAVSYNATWRSQRDSIIAVVPMGYADGYRRALSNKSRVLVRGQLVPVVGTICMDYFMIDVTDLHNFSSIQLGENVELWGPNVNLKQLASSIETIPYELLTTLSPRVPRTYVSNFEEVL